jgi:hypothetical protein
MFNAFGSLVLGSHMLIAVANGPPSIDMQRMCRASASAMVSISGDSSNDYQSCLSDEQAARDQLEKDWATFPARDRSFCALPTEYLPSYIEWLTCFEMERDVRKIRTEQPDEQSASVPAGAKAARHSHHRATKNAD